MFYDFILSNWKIILLGIFLLVILLVIILKKPFKLFEIMKVLILEILPEAIVMAENEYGPGNGQEKKTYALGIVVEAIADRFGLDELLVFKKYHEFIENQIEKILLTPQKK